MIRSAPSRTLRSLAVAAAVSIGTCLSAGALSSAQATEAAKATHTAKPIENEAIHFNEGYVREVASSKDLDPKDLMTVFSLIFNGLPDQVTVYPTENYYYFRFYHDGVRWAGNIRFDVIDRDKGAVHFAYFEAATAWMSDGESKYKVLGSKEGVVLEKKDKLAYDLTYKGRTVRFDLVDLSGVKPPAAALRKDEIYLGPIMDESGIEFFLMFDQKLKTFVYVLNENKKVADRLQELPDAPGILFGRRTGFAYYPDTRADRKILIGVHSSNITQNTYFDGPFDQLPDNFLDRETFRKSIEAAYPSIKGSIDDYGNFNGGEGRFLINPYKTYTAAVELTEISVCAEQAKFDGDYYRCFQTDE